MTVLGVISDTHGLLRDEASRLLRGVDRIIHAGDIGGPEIIAGLEAIAPVAAIRGNIDIQPWASSYEDALRLSWSGRSIFVIHDRNDLAFRPADEGIDLVVCGHSHRPGIEASEGVVYLNPGSAGPRRFKLPVTLATVTIKHGRAVPQIHEIG